MNAITRLNGLRGAALALGAALSLVCAPAPVLAATHYSGGYSGGHYSGGYGGGYRGGYGYGGWHGGYYGWRGGYYGWRGGYGWGWWGWPSGLFLATVPFYYSTLWWNGVPYYYGDDAYYIWSNSANGYVSVVPPPEIAGQAPAPGAAPGGAAPGAGQPGAPYSTAPGATDLFVYPKNSQSEAQVAQDRKECQAWAASQAGAGGASNRGDDLRAQTACLEARGYSVK
jgi:hypothetical protein